MLTKSRFHTLSTKKIQQILNEPYLRGNDGEGGDCHKYESELKSILWARQSKQYEKEMSTMSKVKSRYEMLLEENQELKDELRCLELELENETLRSRISKMRENRFPDLIVSDDEIL
jgi:predicted RNase H-like nuclease (RuvC/YqgF family)